MSHALIVGGTGMLKHAVLYFARHSYTVSVIARGQAGFDKMILEKNEHGFINPVRVDYSNFRLLREKITDALERHGKIDLCIAWIHHHSRNAAYVIADVLNRQNFPFRFFHVLGSETANPSESNIDSPKEFEIYENILYRKIILGFVIEEDNSRWLTNGEISNGVIDAVNFDKETYIVGTVNPWDKIPRL